MAITDPRPTRRRALAGGLAMAACVAYCLLPLAAAGGLLAGVASALAGALLPAVLLGSIAAGAAGAWWWRRRRPRPAAATAACDCGGDCPNGRAEGT